MRHEGIALMAVLTAVLAVAPVAGQARATAPLAVTPPAPATGRWHEASLDEYRTHLTALSALVDACAKGRDTKTCDPLLVGPDDRVPLGAGPNAERRLIRFGWLRVLFSKAEDKDEPAPKPAIGAKGTASEGSTQPAQRTTSELLQDAKARLAHDLAETEGAKAATAAHPQERDMMKQVLAGRDFRGLEEPTARDSALEKFGNWLNRLFESAAKLQSRSVWIGRVIVWGFILAVCVGLIWGLMQLERRWRIRLVPESVGPAPGAASARDWQLWLEDARRTAEAGQWREATHFVYWAAISRLESRRLWPPDRARTPREYLALVPPEDPRRTGLATLTGSFERIWYGGRAAGELDYRKAADLAEGLIARTGTTVIGGGSAR
jgi:hypothetical protein